MKEKIIKENYIKIIAITYLMIFCISKILMLTNIFENMPINTIMFCFGILTFLLLLINKKVELKNYPILLKLFVLVVIINIICNLDIETIKSGLFEIFYVFIIYNIAYSYVQDKDLSILIKIALVLSTIIILIFYIQYIILLIQNMTISKSLIIQTVFSNINGGAILALLNIVMLMYLYKMKQIKLSLTIVLSIFYTIFIFISQARTSLLALIVLLLYFLYQHIFSNEKLARLKKILIIIFMSLIILATVFLLTILLKRDYNNESKIDNIVMKIEYKIADFTTLRYWLWKYSTEELIDNNIFFGLQHNLGEDSFNNIENEELLNSLSASQKEILSRNNLHNGYVQILVRNGLFGILLIITFFIILWSDLNKNKKELEYYKYLLLVFFIINFFENQIILSNSFFVLFLWINIGRINKTLKGRDEKDEGIY